MMDNYMNQAFCISSLKGARIRCRNKGCFMYLTKEHKEAAKKAEMLIMYGEFYNPPLGLKCASYRDKE